MDITTPDRVTAETNQHEIAEHQADKRYNAQKRGAVDDCTFAHAKDLNAEHEPLEHVEAFEMLKAFSECDDPVAFQKALHEHMKNIAVSHAMYARGYQDETVDVPAILELAA